MEGKGDSAPGVASPFIIDALKDGRPSFWLCWRSISGGNVFDAPAIEFAPGYGSMSCEASRLDDIEDAFGWLTWWGSIWSQPVIWGSVMEPGYGIGGSMR